jgi:hypothetical protein
MRGRVGLQRALMLAAAMCAAHAYGEVKAPEYQVKAVFIYKFATYVHWPATPGADATTPFVIGVIGKDPFGPVLDAVVNGQRVAGKVVVVKRLSGLDDAIHCDLLFVCSSERQRLPKILLALRGAPVLTVSDMDQFAESGGMINLITAEDNHIHFDINKDALDQAGLKAASQLLRLGRIVAESRSTRGER